MRRCYTAIPFNREFKSDGTRGDTKRMCPTIPSPAASCEFPGPSETVAKRQHPLILPLVALIAPMRTKQIALCAAN